MSIPNAEQMMNEALAIQAADEAEARIAAYEQFERDAAEIEAAQNQK